MNASYLKLSRLVKATASLIVTSLLPVSALANSVACPAGADKVALVVIDMQPYFAKRGGDDDKSVNMQKLNLILNSQKEALAGAKRAKIPIIIVEYEFDGSDKTNSELVAALGDYKRAKLIRKTTDGMFDARNKGKNELIEFLKKENVGTLVVTGANGGACVWASIQGALEENCSVVAYTSGIADFNYKDYIYPYKYKPGEFELKCNDCSFKELELYNDIDQALRSGGSGTSTSTGHGSKNSNRVQ